jgi:hypothetical protein
MTSPKTLPTQRLASVLAESLVYMTTLHKTRVTLSQIIRDFGIMPQEAILAELREALDQANAAQPMAIPEAIAYLRVNAKRIEQARNRSRQNRGLARSDYDVSDVLDTDATAPAKEIHPTLSLEDIEAKLKSLAED